MKLFDLALVTALAITSGAALAQTAPGDSIIVLVKHTKAQRGDPVQVNFTKFRVTRANFDPNKIEGGKATIEIDATSLTTGVAKRDTQLSDSLDTAKYATITINVDGVKKKPDKTYNANATVKFRGVTKKYPVSFDLVDTAAGMVHIKGEAIIQLTDFKVANPTGPKAGVQNGLVVQLDLHLKNT